MGTSQATAKRKQAKLNSQKRGAGGVETPKTPVIGYLILSCLPLALSLVSGRAERHAADELRRLSAHAK